MEREQKIDELLAELDAEVESATERLPGLDLEASALQQARAYAGIRVQTQAQYVGDMTQARVWRKIGDHAKAEQHAKAGKKAFDVIVALEDVLAEESETVRALYRRILEEQKQGDEARAALALRPQTQNGGGGAA